MGVDITQYRSRIGSFISYRCIQRQKTSKCASRNCVIITCTLLPLFLIGILLLSSGIEANPGPRNIPKDAKAEVQKHQMNIDTGSMDSGDGNVKDNVSLDVSAENGYDIGNSTFDASPVESQIELEQIEENVQTSIRDMLSLPEEQFVEVVPRSSDDKVVMIRNQRQNTLNLTFNIRDTKGPIQLGKSNQVFDIKSDGKEDICSRTCILQHLIDRTKEDIDHQKMTWIDRTGLDELIRCLRTSKMAVLTGICGEGKTRLSLHLMQLTLEGRLPGFTDRIPIKINDPNEWTHAIRSGKDILVLIDDIFGSTNLNETLLRQWEQKLNDIGPDVARGQIMLIVSSRKHIFTEALTLLKHSAYSAITTNLFSEQRHIDLSGRYQLSPKEKHQFVEKAIEQQTKYDIKICGHQKEENISQCQGLVNTTIYIAEQTIDRILLAETPLGFPYLCNLFVSSKEIMSKGVSFFTKSNYYLEKEIDAMFHCDKFKYFTLVYTLLNNKKNTLYLESKKLNPFEMSETDKDTLRKISQACGLTECNVQSIKDAAECLNGVF